MRVVFDPAKFRAALGRAEMTISEFARRAGVERSHISRLSKLPEKAEDYQDGVPLSTLARIVTVLGLDSVDEVLRYIPDAGEVATAQPQDAGAGAATARD